MKTSSLVQWSLRLSTFFESILLFVEDLKPLLAEVKRKFISWREQTGCQLFTDIYLI